MTFDEAIGIAEEWLAGARLPTDPLLMEALDHVDDMTVRLEVLAQILDQRRLAAAFRGRNAPAS